MPVRFRRPGKPDILMESHPKLNLLGHAQIEELETGSRCGGHGICGGDRIQVNAPLGSVSPLTDAEREHLSPSEITQGFRLACQCFPESSSQTIDVMLKHAQDD